LPQEWTEFIGKGTKGIIIITEEADSLQTKLYVILLIDIFTIKDELKRKKLRCFMHTTTCAK
jgi:hypothetical protein